MTRAVDGWERPGPEQKAMIKAMIARPDEAWTVPRLANIGAMLAVPAHERPSPSFAIMDDGHARLAERLVERLTAHGWATAFWDPPQDAFDPQKPDAPKLRTRCYRLTAAGKQNIHRLLEPS